ncbi:MAG TPA: hypothetical protein VLU47_05780 [Blastocatellia bacterium]|nr:hypothetical protein [Blastocatellia bacterium]
MSQNSDDLATQPTATALMERVREVEVRLASDIGALATRLEDQATRLEDQASRSEAQTARLEAQFSALRDQIEIMVQGQISSLREEMKKGFYKLNSRVLSLAEDMLDIRANEREILKRLYDPEITEKTP